MAAASDVGDGAVSCARLVDSAGRCRRLAGLASVHDDDLPPHTPITADQWMLSRRQASQQCLCLSTCVYMDICTHAQMDKQPQNIMPPVTSIGWAEECTGWSYITESMVTTRSPFCGYNTIYCVELNGEDLSCYSNKIEPVSLQSPHDHWLSALSTKRI